MNVEKAKELIDAKSPSSSRDKRLMELYELRRQAGDEYLELRDAKSNGCCSNKSLWQVLAYDELINEAARGCLYLDGMIDGILNGGV
jgi:hypothetical protein